MYCMPARTALSPRSHARSAARVRELALGFALLLGTSACGRVGLELVPLPTEKDAGAAIADTGVTNEDASSGEPSAPRECVEGCTNAHGSAECLDGRCVIDCSSGFADCDGDPKNGCEVDVSGDPMQCGSCGHRCDLDRELCLEGRCEPSACAAGRGECDDDPSTMCETDLTRSIEHCGFCGNACAAAHGTALCEARRCVLDGCDSGYADCDGDYFTGCEADLGSSAHCGRCGRACVNPHGLAECTAGRCTPQCAAGFDDCDGDPDNGCETSLDTTEHCGQCGRSCPVDGGTSVCNAGSCATRCELSGTFALRLALNANWNAKALVAFGSGEFVFWGRLLLTQTDNALAGSLAPCGELVPDFRAAPPLIERYGVSVPEAMFDRGAGLPTQPVSGSLSDDIPGASFMLGRTAILMGAALADPINGAWPSATSISARDSDADGKPGITLPYKSSGTYFHPPTESLGVMRAQAAYIATRLVFGLSGTLDSCNSSSGSVSAQSIDARTLGCRTVTDLRDCLFIEADHLEENTPRYQVGRASYTLHRVADDASCAQVRRALP